MTSKSLTVVQYSGATIIMGNNFRNVLHLVNRQQYLH